MSEPMTNEQLQAIKEDVKNVRFFQDQKGELHRQGSTQLWIKLGDHVAPLVNEVERLRRELASK